jgi:hypothetical protein
MMITPFKLHKIDEYYQNIRHFLLAFFIHNNIFHKNTIFHVDTTFLNSEKIETISIVYFDDCYFHNNCDPIRLLHVQ